jgi:hypothetical protein
MGTTSRDSRRKSFWRRREVVIGAAALVVAGLVVLILVVRGGSAPTPPVASTSATPSAAPTATPMAAVPDSVTGQTIDGIQCQTTEQLVYHIHAHLAIYVNGSARSVPYGVGVTPPRKVVATNEGPLVEGGKCFYWLHTHTGDGIVHVESPTQAAYTLGQFFDIWQQPLNTTTVGPATGTLFIYVNGQKYAGDPRAIPLTAHGLIQLDVGTDVPPASFSFPPGV